MGRACLFKLAASNVIIVCFLFFKLSCQLSRFSTLENGHYIISLKWRSFCGSECRHNSLKFLHFIDHQRHRLPLKKLTAVVEGGWGRRKGLLNHYYCSQKVCVCSKFDLSQDGHPPETFTFLKTHHFIVIFLCVLRIFITPLLLQQKSQLIKFYEKGEHWQIKQCQ